ncbi:unnamed protein product [Closterium sp. NIES-53]
MMLHYEMQGLVEEQERASEVAVLAPQAQTAVVTAAAVGEDVGPVEGGVTASAGSAETPVAAVGADTQGRDQVASDTPGRGNGAAARATSGNGVKKFCAQPALRRPEQGWYLAPRDPSWAGFCKGIRHNRKVGVDQIMSSRGVRQGDPLGPLLFSATIQPTLLSTATLLPEVAIVTYANDITIVGPRDAAYETFINIATELTSLGLHCNIAKSTGWGQSMEEGNEIPPPRGLPINTTGIGVLGSPIGTPAFCTDQAQM